MAKPYRIRLSKEERSVLVALTRRGEAQARQITRARILLLADGGASDRTIADALQVDPRTCQRLRKRACQEGTLPALLDRPRPGAARLLDDTAEAHLIALACSDAPDGRAQWTMQLLADRLVELQIVPTISDETVRRTLKKTS